MRRRTVSAVVTTIATALALSACTSSPNHKTDKPPTATVMIKPMPLNHKTSFKVTLGAKGTNGSYQITYRYGDLTEFHPNISASTFGAEPMTDTILGSACKLRKDERAIPFVISALGITGDSGTVHFWLAPVLNQDNKELSPPKGTVRLEYSGFTGGAQCNKNATLGTPTAYGFYGPASQGYSGSITGWIILSGVTLSNPRYQLAVMSSAYTSDVGANTISDVKGGKPYATYLATSNRRAVAGSSVPLMPVNK